MRPERVPNNRQHRFKVSCGTCGDVELGAEALGIQATTVSGGGTYSFECPRCGRATVRAAASRVVELLISAGVPARPARDQAIGDGPIREDEVVAFVTRLHRDDTWLAEILG